MALITGKEDALVRKDKDERLNPQDVLGEDGLWRCGICHERKEKKLMFLGRTKIVHCVCRCEREEREIMEQHLARMSQKSRMESLAYLGIDKRQLNDMSFAKDNGLTTKMYLARNYVDKWETSKEGNFGYILSGSVGCGKTFMAGCIANALLEQGVCVVMTNFSKLFNELTVPGADKNKIIGDLVSVPLLILDDFGIEHNSSFAMEQLYELINRRYGLKLPMIVTTNLTREQMLWENNSVMQERIYSRLLEMCVFVKIEGENQRERVREEKKKRMVGELLGYQQKKTLEGGETDA